MEQNEVNEQILHKFRTLEEDYPIKNVGAAMDGVADSPSELKVSGENLEKLEDIGREVKDDLEAIDHISSANIEVAKSAEEYTFQLNVAAMEDDDNINDKKSLLNHKVTTINGEKKLSDYIDLEETNSLTEINRADGERYISIHADIEGQDISTVNNEINKIIEDTSVDQGYS